MSSAFTNLVSKIENYYADRDYTTEDAEHLSKLAIVEYAKTQNALVASARQVPEASIDNIIETAITLNLNADPSEWMVFAANAVDNVLNYSHSGIIASGLGEYTDFLPVGHPSRTNRDAMTASALARATALWVAGDPRIASEQARLDVYAAYATKPGSVEAEYASAKLGALVAAGYVPEDVTLPITAAFKMSFALRSAMSKALAAVRRRHGDGRFAEEFGRLRGFFSRGDGSIFSSNGRIVGAIPNTNNFEVQFPGDADIPKGVYTLDASRTSSLKAILSKRALKNVKGLKPTNSISNPTESQKRMAVSLDEFLATRKDAPSGWTKNDDGSFTSKSGHTSRVVDAAPEGDYMTEGVGEGGKIDPTQPIFELTDKDGKLLGIGQDWAGLNKISMTYDALNGEGDATPEEPGLDQKPGDGSNWFDSAIDWDHLSDPQNWKDLGGSAEYTSPDGKLELNWEADGEGDVGFGATDLSGISVTYDGQYIGSYRASYRDLEDGDTGDGLEKLLKQESWFSPDNLLKSSDDGKTYEFANDEGIVSVERDGKKYKVTKEIAQGMIDENLEHSYYDTQSYDTKEEAHRAAEDFAKLLQDPYKVQDLLYEDWQNMDYGFDQAPGTKKRSSLEEAEKYIQEFKDAVGDKPRQWQSEDGRVRITRKSNDPDVQDDVIKNMDDWVIKVDGKEVGSIGTGSYGDKSIDDLDNPAYGPMGLKNYIEGGLIGDPEKARKDAVADYWAAQDAKNNTPEAIAARERSQKIREANAKNKKDAAEARKNVDKYNFLDNADKIADAVYGYDGDSATEVDLGNGFLADFGSWDQSSDGYDYRYVDVYPADENATQAISFKQEMDQNGDWYSDGIEVHDAIHEMLDKEAGNEGKGYNPKDLTYSKVAGKDVDPEAGLDQKPGEDKAEAPAKPLSEKQMEPATDKQYALLEELNSERDGIDPVTQKAIDDALANKNLTKAQMASLFGELTKKPFKADIDPTKPTERQINSLQGYLTTKELTPDEMNDILAQLDAGLDRDAIEKLTAKLRRRPDRAQNEGFDQAPGEGYREGENIDDIANDVKARGQDIVDQIEDLGPVEGESSDEFKQRIADLRLKVDSFADTVRVFNQDIVERSGINPDRNVSGTDFDPLYDELENLASEGKKRRADAAYFPGQPSRYYSSNQSSVDYSNPSDDMPVEALAAGWGFSDEGNGVFLREASNEGDRATDYEIVKNEKTGKYDVIRREHSGLSDRSGQSADYREYNEGSYDSPAEAFKDYGWDDWEASDAEDAASNLPDGEEPGFDQNAGSSEWTKKLRFQDKNGYQINASPQEADKDIRDRIDAAIEKGVADAQTQLAKLEADGQGDSDEAKELKRGIDQFAWAARSSGKFGSNKQYMSKDGAFEGPFNEVIDAWKEQKSRDEDRSNKNQELAKNWGELSDDQKDEIAYKVANYFDKWEQEDPRDFFASMHDFAKNEPAGRHILEKPERYVPEYLDYMYFNDEEGLGNLLDAANVGFPDEGFDQAPGKTLSPKMMEPATEAQYNYLKNLSETKAGIDPETAQAIKEALEGNNLTKAQAGGFIGKLRDLGDKENVGQYGKPSQKMIDSVNRDVYAKGLSDADREEILKNLENLSKGDVSAIISRLKELPDVPGGMNNYINSLVAKGDLEALKRLREDGRFGDYNVDLDNAISKLESGDKGFNQAPGKQQYGSMWEPMKPELISLAEEFENADETGYSFLNKEFVEDLDPNDIGDAYYLYSELMDAYKAMRPTSEEGKALEARLKKAADDLLAKIESDMGPIEAAKRDPDDLGSTFEFDKAVDDLPDFFDYYFPTKESDDMRNDPDGGSVGDNRGGGWEGRVSQNEETGKWEADMSSPGQASESYSEEFDDQDDAADWIANELDRQNTAARNYDTSILAEDGLDGLIKEYGDDPEKLAEVLEGIIGWLKWTNRGQAENIARSLDDYLDRLRAQLAKNPKA